MDETQALIENPEESDEKEHRWSEICSRKYRNLTIMGLGIGIFGILNGANVLMM